MAARNKNDRLEEERETLTNKTNESCAAAELIRAQGQQMEVIDVLEYLRRKYGVKGEDAGGQEKT